MSYQSNQVKRATIQLMIKPILILIILFHNLASKKNYKNIQQNKMKANKQKSIRNMTVFKLSQILISFHQNNMHISLSKHVETLLIMVQHNQIQVLFLHLILILEMVQQLQKILQYIELIKYKHIILLIIYMNSNDHQNNEFAQGGQLTQQTNNQEICLSQLYLQCGQTQQEYNTTLIIQQGQGFNHKENGKHQENGKYQENGNSTEINRAQNQGQRSYFFDQNLVQSQMINFEMLDIFNQSYEQGQISQHSGQEDINVIQSRNQ